MASLRFLRNLLRPRAGATAHPWSFAGGARRARTSASGMPPSPREVPRITVLLGGAGLAPFMWYGLQIDDEGGAPWGRAIVQKWDAHLPGVAAAVDALLPGGGSQEEVRRAFLAYSAVILSFLGGVHWGAAAMAAPGAAGVTTQYVLSVLPSLVGWGALTHGLPRGAAAQTPAAASDALGVSLRVFSLSFLAMYVVDEVSAGRGRLPRWYTHVRTPLTFAVATTQIVAAWRTRPQRKGL
jgi:hypothetical protein